VSESALKGRDSRRIQSLFRHGFSR
jgi:hypothetical protein